MSLIANIVVGLIGVLHVYILVLEMFLWDKPAGLRAFGQKQEFATASKVLAANQGLYNGFLAAGLFWGLSLGAVGFGVLAIWAVAIGAGAVAFVILPLAQGELTRLGAGRLLPRAFGSFIRYPAAFALMFAAFASTYVFVPEKSPSWSAAARGGAVAAACWAGVSLLFSYLLPKVWHVSLFNGAMSSVLAILIWAYCGAWGVLIGAVVTVRLDEA